MTASDVERQLTALLHRHAEDTMNQTDTPTELHLLQARVEQETTQRQRRRGLMAAAAVAAAAVGIGAAWLGTQATESQPTATSPSDTPSSSPSPSRSEDPVPEAPQTPGSTVRGFDGFEDFPMSFVVPDGFSGASVETGTRGYAIDGTSGAVGAFVVSDIAGTRAADLPADIATHIRENRDDLVVSDVRSTDVGGRTAQSFTLAQRRGTSPSDLWCVRSGSCYKLLGDKPMDMTFVRTPRGLVLFEAEYLRRDETRVQQPVQRWLGSVRWQ
ncbi:MAG: hypothetical protein ACKOVB_05495 [Terrabacter sp.]